MTAAVMRDLQAALEEADGTDDVRAITLLGRGNVFCAGIDLEMMRDRAEGAHAPTRDAFPELLATLESTTVPTVAGIKRAAPAGAFELTLPCDFRVLGADATDGVIEVTLGTFPTAARPGGSPGSSVSRRRRNSSWPASTSNRVRGRPSDS
jgi:enoyl-CoA hydratase/carnithine racemase